MARSSLGSPISAGRAATDADYKRFYGIESRDEALLRFYGSSLRARIARKLDAGSQCVVRSIRHVMQRTRVVNRVKKFWRDRLEKHQ